MRDGPTNANLAGAVLWRPVISSSLGDAVLADSIPIISGQYDFDMTQQIPERVTLTVPEWADGVSWVPEDPSHPLAKFGQRIDVQLAVTAPVSAEDWQIRLGQFLLQDWQHDSTAGVVTVTCVGLLQVASDAKFRTPQVPRTGDTFVSAFTRLMPDGLGVNFDAALVDRALPQSFQWDQDRIGALYDIADAWPARIRVDQFGTVQVLPPLPDVPVPVLTLTDGEAGTLISAPAGDTRDQVYNVVVAQSSATDDPSKAPVQAVAEVSGGALDPDTYGEVVRFYASPLVTTQAQCLSAANAILAASIRPANQRVAIIAPDPRIEADDALSLVKGTAGFLGGRTDNGWVVGGTIPLTIGDGPMTLKVGIV